MFRKYECRALMLMGSRTSIALEPAFWKVADRLAKSEGISWQEWATARLQQGAGGRASGLRVAILEASQTDQ